MLSNFSIAMIVLVALFRAVIYFVLKRKDHQHVEQ